MVRDHPTQGLSEHPEPVRAEGFILQASYRVENRIPVVHLYGKLANGDSFLVRDRRERPRFYVDRKNLEKARSAGATALSESDSVSFGGEPLARVEVALPTDVPKLRDRLHAAEVVTYESDVRFAVRYLIDRNVRGGCVIEGTPQPSEEVGIDCVFNDPLVEPAPVAFSPKLLSFDIETDAEASRLLAISLFGDALDEVYIVAPDGVTSMPENAIGLPSEEAVLDAFMAKVQSFDPDILTGWNVIGFDLRVLDRVARRHDRSFEIGRGGGVLRLRLAEGRFGNDQATVPGRLVLDGIQLLRGAYVKMDDYSLDAVARTVLGEGKVLEGDVGDRAAEILDRYHHDLVGFAAYARADARLAYQILEKLDLINLSVARSRLTGMPLDRVAASIASFDFVYLAALAQKHIHAPSVRPLKAPGSSAQGGGHVLEPVTGMHENVWVLDYKSLYPCLMRTFNIDPLTYVRSGAERSDDIRTPTGAAFRRGDAILPNILDELFRTRERAKRDSDEVASQAIKILMNSFYGVLGTSGCRFHNPDIANSITGLGRHFLLWSKAWFEKAGFQVVYGDTDSVFVRSGIDDSRAARDEGNYLTASINADLARYVRDTWQVESRLELEFEKLYRRLFLPSIRHGSVGARKRYAGVLEGEDVVEFVGMEVVRRDWTELAKNVQRELYIRLFADGPVLSFLHDYVKDLRSGDLDDHLVYRKGLRKALHEYTAITPPHVVAARKAKSPGRVVSYVMTTAGPEPLDNVEHELDREHYVQRQVRPVAEPVLEAMGLEFDRAIGDDRQLGLF